MVTWNNALNFFKTGGDGLQRLKVAGYLFSHTDYNTNTVSCTYDDISRETGISYDIVADMMQRLQKTGMIKSVAPRVWLFAEKLVYGPDEDFPDEEAIMIERIGEEVTK